jgi:AraC-like DNA-binding protein
VRTITATVGGRFGLFDHLTEPVVADIRAEPAMHAAFDQLLRELGMPGVGSRALSEALMKQCLVLLMRNLLARGGAETALFSAIADPRLARTVSAVLADPGAPHTVQSLAVEAGMSRSVFAERFVAAYGESPFEFVQSARLDHAARLLRISDLPVNPWPRWWATPAAATSPAHFAAPTARTRRNTAPRLGPEGSSGSGNGPGPAASALPAAVTELCSGHALW